MTRAYLDTNFLYVHLRRPPTGREAQRNAWVSRVRAALTDDAAVISPLVVDELAYRLVLAWLRDDGVDDPLTAFRSAPGATTARMGPRLAILWNDLDELRLEMALPTEPVIDRAKEMMTSPGLAPRDAFHAALALQSRCALIVSVDREFDRVDGLSRLGPDD